MNRLFLSPLIGLGPQLALAAGLLGVLLSGMSRQVPAFFLKFLGVAALLGAAALAALSFPGGVGTLIRLDGMGLSWQFLFYAGALPLAFLIRVGSQGDDEIPVALFLGSALGMGLLASSWNLLMLFIGLELMSLPAYLLVARGGGKVENPLEAGIKYFFAGGTASSLFLLGLALYYASSRSLALVGAPGPMAEAGLALMGAAALFKVGAVPLHFWLPDAYEAASPELAGFLSTSMKSAGILLLMRLAALLPQSAFASALPAFGALTMVFGALLALRQVRLQRLLAYSSIAHAGNMILGVGAWAAQGALPGSAAPVFFYLLAYLFMSNGAFCFLKVSGISTREELRGYAKREPVPAALFAALLLALAGIPPTGGFLAKLLIFWEAFKAGLYLPLLAAGLAALIALGYYLALIRDMYFEEAEVPAPVPSAGRSILWACVVPAALLGLAPWLLGPLSGALSR